MTIDRERLRKIRFLRTAYRWAKLITGQPAEFGMTSSQEQSYFINCARSEYKGAGEIVDLGCWLGSTTISLVKGLLKNPNIDDAKNRKVHAYDLFLWHRSMEPIVAGSSLDGRFEPGDSLLDEFNRRTSTWSDSIQVHQGDVCEIGWNGAAIELLLVDVMKTWRVAEGVVRHFYPSLIPHASILIHQDFAHYYTSWIHLLQYRFRDHFAFHHDVPGSASTVFRYLDPIPDELLRQPFSFDSFGDEEIDAAFELSLQTVRAEKRPEVAAAKVMTFIHMGDTDRARFELEGFQKVGIPLRAGLRTVEEMLL